jgi:hypothetical protein
MSKKLTGDDLLKELEILKTQGLSMRTIAKHCGYTSVHGRTQYSQFLEAIAIAKGVLDKLPDGRGNKANYQTTVHANGTVVIGGFYIKEIGFKAGDRLEIKLGYKHIKLVRISDSEQIENTGENS